MDVPPHLVQPCYVALGVLIKKHWQNIIVEIASSLTIRWANTGLVWGEIKPNWNKWRKYSFTISVKQKLNQIISRSNNFVPLITFTVQPYRIGSAKAVVSHGYNLLTKKKLIYKKEQEYKNRLNQLLYILTSVWVLHTPNAGWNMVF